MEFVCCYFLIIGRYEVMARDRVRPAKNRSFRAQLTRKLASGSGVWSALSAYLCEILVFLLGLLLCKAPNEGNLVALTSTGLDEDNDPQNQKAQAYDWRGDPSDDRDQPKDCVDCDDGNSEKNRLPRVESHVGAAVVGF